ncbi:MAG: hypothetical protein RL839_06705 [Gammaproteobacteria bacterium]
MMNAQKRLPSAQRWNRSKGFSLFELVVFIICVAIIYAAAARRFTEFPGEAERANFVAVAAQIQTGINLELMVAMTRGQGGAIRAMANSNPMDLLLDPPSNYLGSFDFVDKSSIERRSWYYDQSQNELVYLVNNAEGVYLLVDGRRVETDEIRFVVEPQYRINDPATGLPLGREAQRRLENESRNGPPEGAKLSGLLLEPVVPYEWESNITELAGAGVLEG